MKRQGDIFGRVCSFENLLKAAKKAQRGKRFKFSTAAFNLRLEQELLIIQQELQSQSYRMGSYRHFFVFDPKRRFISAAPYVDRVVQHALCNVIEPIFDRSFINETYACRKDKGTHKAVDRFTVFARRNVYVLKCDVRNYFATIDHEVLLRMIERKIKDPNVLWLIRAIIDSTSNPGIPIGNLTSQIFANLYLNDLDHFVKESLKCRYYLRYMDDLIFFGNSRTELIDWKEAISSHLDCLKLVLHQGKSQIYETSGGVSFLGYKVYPTHRLVLTQNVCRFRRKIKKYLRLFGDGIMSRSKIIASVQSWLGYAGQADSYFLCKRLFNELKIKEVSP